MHLVSRYRYPMMSVLPTETAVDYLLSAPKIVRELQPMHWTFLDGPPDGTVMLTWQPLNHLGTNFASDGFVWADAEQAFTFEAKGYVRANGSLASNYTLTSRLDCRNVASSKRLPSSERESSYTLPSPFPPGCCESSQSQSPSSGPITMDCPLLESSAYRSYPC